MWFFLPIGWFSATLPRAATATGRDSTRIQVRARMRGHLLALIARYSTIIPPDAQAIQDGGGTDYRWRIFLTKEQFSALMAKIALDITYGNFKGEAARLNPPQSPYVQALHEVWHIGMNLQRTADRAEKTKHIATEPIHRPARRSGRHSVKGS